MPRTVSGWIGWSAALCFAGALIGGGMFYLIVQVDRALAGLA